MTGPIVTLTIIVILALVFVHRTMIRLDFSFEPQKRKFDYSLIDVIIAISIIIFIINFI